MEQGKLKDQVARELIDWHFETQPDLIEVYRIIGQDEDAPGEPIKLLEINDATVSTGTVEPFVFMPTKEVPFPTMIAEITPDEFESLRRSPDALPKGWSLSSAKHFPRPKAA